MSVRKNNISEIENVVQWCDVNQHIVNVGKTDLDIRPEKNNSVNISTGTSLHCSWKAHDEYLSVQHFSNNCHF